MCRYETGHMAWLNTHVTKVLKVTEMEVDYALKKVEYCFSRRNSVI
jgi:hypothetical protein